MNSKEVTIAAELATFRRVVFAGRSVGLWFGRMIIAAADRLYAWQERARERRQLLSLDDRALKDIGLSRCDIVRLVRGGVDDRRTDLQVCLAGSDGDTADRSSTSCAR